MGLDSLSVVSSTAPRRRPRAEGSIPGGGDGRSPPPPRSRSRTGVPRRAGAVVGHWTGKRGACGHSHGGLPAVRNIGRPVEVLAGLLLSRVMDDRKAKASYGTEEYVAWKLIAAMGNAIEVEAQVCALSHTRFKEWRVEESSASVVVRAVVERSAARNHTNDLVLIRSTLQLQAPLGGRKLTGCRPHDMEFDCRRHH
jgi:hypothetical protein